MVKVLARNKPAVHAEAPVQQEPRASCVREHYPALVRNSRLRSSDLRHLRAEAAGFESRPHVSLILTIDRAVSSKGRLSRTLDSVLGQIYPEWEVLPVYSDEVEGPARDALARYGRVDGRISSEAREDLNAALSWASGAFVGVLHAGDELSPDALFETVRLLQQHPDADLVYADEDRIDERGGRWEPHFKPGWSPDLLLSTDYVSCSGIYRKDLLDRIGGFREEFGGACGYDLNLRLTERTTNIHHVPKVLYHRCEERIVPKDAGRRVLAEALERRGIEGSVEDGLAPGVFRVKPEVRGEPKVSIILPTGGVIPLLSRCIESVEARTTYSNYEIVIVDNSRGKAASYLTSTPHRVVVFEGDFDYSAINNLGVREATGEYVLLLNDDTEVISEDWLEEMLRHAQKPDVGAVGTKLLYPDGLIQHAGVITGAGNSWGPSLATHSHVRYPGDAPGYANAVNTVRNSGAVTAACMMVRKTLYEELGGLDHENLPVAFQDVDLCMRMRERGYVVVYTPYAELYHHESASKGRWAPREEISYMRERWGEALDEDPYYNPNFSSGGGDFELRADLLRPKMLRVGETEDRLPWTLTEEEQLQREYVLQKTMRSLRKSSLVPVEVDPKDRPPPVNEQERGLYRRPVDRSVRADQVVWMFGSSRTGSTWMSRIMAELDNQERWHEPYVGLLFGAFLYKRIKDHKLRRSDTFIMGEPHREAWISSIRNFVLEGAEARFPDLGREQYLVIKEPNGSIGAPLLMEATPESAFIFLIRDPRDVIASRMEAFREGGWATQVRDYSTTEKLLNHTRQLAEDYLEVVTKVKEAYDAHEGRKAFVRYEELRPDTVNTLMSMYEDLAIEVDRGELEAAVQKHAWEAIPEAERGPGKFYRKAQPGSWNEDLTPEQIELIEEVTAPILSELYPDTFSPAG